MGFNTSLELIAFFLFVYLFKYLEGSKGGIDYKILIELIYYLF